MRQVSLSLEGPLDYKEIKPVNFKGNQSWIFIERTDPDAETLIPWPPDAKNWLIWKDPDSGKDWRQEEKRMTQDEMVGWHHRLNGHEFSKLQELVFDQGAWCSAVHEIAKSHTWLSTWTKLKRCRFSTWVGKIPWRRAYQPPSSILAWRIPWREEPGSLQSIGSQRVKYD